VKQKCFTKGWGLKRGKLVLQICGQLGFLQTQLLNRLGLVAFLMIKSKMCMLNA